MKQNMICFQLSNDLILLILHYIIIQKQLFFIVFVMKLWNVANLFETAYNDIKVENNIEPTNEYVRFKHVFMNNLDIKKSNLKKKVQCKCCSM